MEDNEVRTSDESGADRPAEPPAEPPPEPAPASRAPGPAGPAYRVALDTYSGPLDLLLYLIRRSEVDIQDIPIAEITEQYQAYLGVMAEINVNVAGEFLVMAATLMEIKSRMLLPREELEEAEEEDPRVELVRQLLEYKRYKDLARELGARAAQQALKFPRPAADGLPAEPGEAAGAAEGEDGFLDGIGLWELIDAFAKVMSETRLGAPGARVLEHERPLHEYRRELLAIVHTQRRVLFAHVFADCRTREDMIAMFIALLELVRLRRLALQQAGAFGEIYVFLADELPGARARPTERAAEAPAPKPEGRAPRRPAFLEPTDRIDELEQEAASLGRARERIDAAIKRAEAFLKQHQQQSHPEEPPTDAGEVGPRPDPAGPEPLDAPEDTAAPPAGAEGREPSGTPPDGGPAEPRESPGGTRNA